MTSILFHAPLQELKQDLEFILSKGDLQPLLIRNPLNK
jgi:hypothetical protein